MKPDRSILLIDDILNSRPGNAGILARVSNHPDVVPDPLEIQIGLPLVDKRQETARVYLLDRGSSSWKRRSAQ